MNRRGQNTGHGDSENDAHNQFEVMFPPRTFSHRRKASLVMAEDARHPDEETACFVHCLIAGEGLTPAKIANVRVPKDKSKLKADIVSNNSAISDIAVEEEEEVDVGDKENERRSISPQSEVESRHLTKKQLSDMAWNVRNLSKKLDNIRIRLNVKTVFLVTKAGDESVVSSTREVTRWLLSKDRGTQYVLYVENKLQVDPEFDYHRLLEEDPSTKDRLKFWDTKLASEQAHLFDLVITLGGDGTVLYTSWLFQHVVPPVLSFSLGSLGFLTKFDFNHYKDILESAIKDGVLVSLRLRFECTIMRSNPHRRETPAIKKQRDLVEELIGDETEGTLSHRPDGVAHILNDIVVDRGPNPTMSSIELFGGDEHFTTLQADGVCIATPTGSTAYNMAAGGSLSHPDNPVILITAICAHTLSFRPIILPDTVVLRVGVPYDARTSSWASFDGRQRVELLPGDYVTVSASRYPFANILPHYGERGDDWMRSLSKTLNWNTRQRQKSMQ
ncbi:ATP-NAD kinase-like domain-containing protein [Aspergillus cavernicola]|uniref:ATP-NAD kinase-like domain-containing protein n=1 Tax=Aspergillus cavernicola TaxID=176166 RepID=A0ABR4IQM5_9EURO